MWYLGRMWDEDGIISTSKCAIFAFIYISFLNTQILCFCSMLVHIKPKFKSFVNYVLALRLAKTTKLFSKSASNLAETTSSSKFNFLFLQNFHQAKLFLQSGANLPRIYLYLQVEISKNILSLPHFCSFAIESYFYERGFFTWYHSKLKMANAIENSIF